MTGPKSPSLQFKPQHPDFGAECSGVDFSRPVSEDVISAIRAGMAKYGVLVFRQTALDDAGHVAFAGQFGELDDSTTWIKAGQKYRLAPYVQLTDVGNLEEDGLPVSTDSMRHQINLGNGLFHVDCSYNARRAGFSLLRAHQLPPRGTGGGTEFADTRTAYADLDQATKDKIQDLVLCHSLWYSRQLGAPDNAILKQIDPAAQAMGRHKLVQLHEPSGRQNLYIAWHAHHVDGWSKEASRPVIEDLLRHASQDKYTFRVDSRADVYEDLAQNVYKQARARVDVVKCSIGTQGVPSGKHNGAERVESN
ncbi:putative TauD/TfdA-like domain-containing protein [Seiridium cardinale]|uniref:TauD/TfdA-like domain-containing protein n=1 Tax=Seiridium cardinale TaxID=138064 RepID=A0ABR2Y9K6_9PEZI